MDSDDALRALTAPGALFEVAEEDVRGSRMLVFAHRARALRDLFDEARRFGERTYLVDGAVQLTYRRLGELVDALAHALQQELGVQPGDRVGIFAANRWDWIVTFWAVTNAGGVPTAYNGWWTADEAAHTTALVDPVLVIGDGPRLARLAGPVPTLDLDVDIPRLLAAHAGTAPEPVAVDEDDPALLLFTSGTTGRSKAVTVPHRAVCGFAQMSAFQELRAAVSRGAPVPAAGELLAARDDVVLVTSPLFHLSMLYGVALIALTKGAKVVLLPGRFDPDRVLRTIESERVTRWSALGSAAVRVVSSPLVDTCDTSSLRYIGVGGAPVSPSVQQGLRRAFPSVSHTLGMGYTSTEAGAMVANSAGADLEAHPTSTGRLSLTVAVEIRDGADRPVPEGEEGVIHVRSPYVMLGYWNDPEASAAVLKPGGWLSMGDVGRLEGGRLYINARARDMILVNAENVSPTEVEYRLDEHPGVVEAAVLAVDDPMTGDAVCAVVVVDPEGPATKDELQAWCAAALAHYKVPTRWHLVTDPLPRTATGKVVKAEVRRLLADG